MAARSSHPVDAGDAIIDSDQNVGLLAGREFDDRGGQSVAILEAVRNEIADVRAHCPQRADADGTGGRAVAIVVGDDEHARTGFDRVGEQSRRLGGAAQRVGRQQGREAVIELVAMRYPACRIDARQQRVNAGIDQRLHGASGCGTRQDACHETEAARLSRLRGRAQNFHRS